MIVSEILGQTPSFSALSFVSQCPLGNVSHQASAQCTTDHSQLPNLRPSSSHRSPKPMGRSRPCRLVFRTIAAHLQRHCNCQLHLEQSFAHCKAINNPIAKSKFALLSLVTVAHLTHLLLQRNRPTIAVPTAFVTVELSPTCHHKLNPNFALKLERTCWIPALSSLLE